jgi:uncharacterized membrane protein YwaF
VQLHLDRSGGVAFAVDTPSIRIKYADWVNGLLFISSWCLVFFWTVWRALDGTEKRTWAAACVGVGGIILCVFFVGWQAIIENAVTSTGSIQLSAFPYSLNASSLTLLAQESC